MRRWLWAPLLFVGGFHGYLMTQWIPHWGFFGGIAHWFATFSDPISAAAALDLMGLMVIGFVVMYLRERKWTRALSIVVIPYIVFPVFGAVLYLMISDQTLPGENRRSP
jgi:predicted PurR-regulated permease PerM